MVTTGGGADTEEPVAVAICALSACVVVVEARDVARDVAVMVGLLIRTTYVAVMVGARS